MYEKPFETVENALARQAAGKTTLALNLAEKRPSLPTGYAVQTVIHLFQYAGDECYPLGSNIEAISLNELMRRLSPV